MAVEIPEEVREYLARKMAPLFDASLPGLRPVQEANLHLTVKFLGEISHGAVADATSALSVAAQGFSSIPLHTIGGGVYPGKRRPRVLWVGLGGGVQALQSLRDGVEESMEEVGFPQDTRAQFRPHVTVARFRANAAPSTVQAALDHVLNIPPEVEGRFTVEGLSLMRSTLSKGGAVYDRLALAPLNGEGHGPT